MLGVILPRDEALIRLVERIEDLVVVIFLPMYFTLSGLNTNVASIDSLRGVGILCLVIATAVIGKLVACYLSGLYRAWRGATPWQSASVCRRGA